MQKPKMFRLKDFLPSESQISFYVAHSIFKETSILPMHSHDFFEFFIVRKGCLIHTVNGSKYEMEAQSLKFIFPTDVHTIEKHPDSDFVIITNVAFTVEVLDSLIKTLGINPLASREQFKPHLSNIDENMWNVLISKIDQLIGLIYSKENRILNTIFYSILLDVIAEFSGKYGTINDSIPKWLLSAYTEIRKKDNFVQGISKLVELSGKTQEHLTRKLKEYYNVSPSLLINRLRLEEAAHMLMNSNESVTNICFEVGFDNLSYFAKLFKDKYGVSPLKYRHLNMKNILYHDFYSDQIQNKFLL